MKNYRNNILQKRKFRNIQRAIYSLSAWVLLGSFLVWPAIGEDLATKGAAALRSGDYSAAKEYFAAAINDESDSEESQLGLLQAMRITGEYRESLERLDDFLTVRPDSAVLYLEGGRIYSAVGEYAKAEESLRRSMILSSTRSTVRMEAERAIAALLRNVGRKDEARRFWNSLIDAYGTGTVEGSRRLGAVAVAAWREGFILDARDIFLDATDPQVGQVSLDALTDFGYLFLEKYNATEAMNSFKDCLKLNEFYPDALIGMARAKKYENDLEVEVYSRAVLEINPNHVAARNMLAELALEAEYYEAALNEIKAALNVNPLDLESLSLLAVHHFILGDMAGFSSVEEKILTVNPAYGRFYYVLAENLVSRRKYREAVEFSRKAIELDPELWPAYVTLGMNLTRIGDLEGGRDAMERAYEGDPFNVWAVNSLELLDQMDTFVESKSDHFHYRMAAEEGPVLSSHAARLAEEVYEKLAGRYGFKPEGPIFIEFFPDHAGFAVRTLGLVGLEGALGVCFGKVIALDSPLARKSGSFNWGTTLWHEFAHVITMQMTNHNIPRWFSEGLSVFEEYKARPGWGDGIDLSFIRAYNEGKLLKASELNKGFTRPESPGQVMLSYLQSALVCQWMEETFGFESIRQSLLLFAENKPAEEVFLQTLGLDPAGMDLQYAQYIDRRVQDIADRIVIDQPDAAFREAPGEILDLETLAQRLNDKPDDFFANLHMGVQLQNKGAVEEAEVYLKKAQELFPYYTGQGNPYQLLSQMYLETDREDEALLQLEKWIRMDCNSLEPLVKAAEIYRKREDWSSLVRVLDLSIYIHPYEVEIQQQLGRASLELGNWDLAIAAYKALLALNTTDPAGAHLDLAEAFFASGDRDAAKDQTLRSLEIAPRYLKAQKLLLKLSGDGTE
jgi:tetratricopeptide (TPR) repeat protein